eukprot:Gb_04342 [translate_table: standard]
MLHALLFMSHSPNGHGLYRDSIAYTLPQQLAPHGCAFLKGLRVPANRVSFVRKIFRLSKEFHGVPSSILRSPVSCSFLRPDCLFYCSATGEFVELQGHCSSGLLFTLCFGKAYPYREI